MSTRLAPVTDTDAIPETDDEDGPGRSRKGRKALAIALGLVVLGSGAAAVDIVAGRHQHRAAAGPRTAPPTDRGAPVPPLGAPSVAPPAGPSSQDLTVPVTTPKGLTWSWWAGELEPASATAGPAHVSGAVTSGYARTPLGAVIAAQQIASRYLASPNGGWRAVTLAQVVPGPGRDAYLKARAKVSDAAPAAGYAQPAGFRYVSWTPDVAVVQLAAQLPGRSGDGLLVGYQVATATLLWLDGDWRLQLQPDGGVSPTATRVPTPSGFVLWGAPHA